MSEALTDRLIELKAKRAAIVEERRRRIDSLIALLSDLRSARDVDEAALDNAVIGMTEICTDTGAIRVIDMEVRKIGRAL